MTVPHRRVLAAIAVGLAGLLLTACNNASAADGSADPAPTTSTTPAVATAPTPADPTEPAPSADSSTADASTASAATASAPAVAAGGSACDLVTEDDVASAVGSDPGPGSPFTSHGASQCQYGDYQGPAFVLVNLTPTQGQESYDHMLKDPHVSDGGTITEISGVGDQSFGVSGPHTSSIFFTKGDALVVVMVETSATVESPDAQVLALAKIAAGRV